ncbi:MAG: 4-(cytidine 5'-diphospho)-2-C-methyl-D-erythritol kinase [Curvibacter sp.]|jgi:4-diphosphocytidyl-2-C-methyl-D-erythritol kinase|nr:4-(cytidine 5'-diphospho)-2-C-methyl-D-erythritol kinase [Curvibacter sp.]
MQSIHDVPAPAKLNLFLHVTGRRPDGYHLLQSVFMLIDWADTLHFERRGDGQLSREDLLAPLPADDLALRAARALQTASGTTWGAHISVEKRLPAQAGMGGGSSDAATTLMALNRLWGLDLTLEQLCALGMRLGADVPFFLRGRNAWVEGIGEEITPVALPPRQVLVVKPADGLDTSAVFSDPNLKRDSTPATIAGFAADPLAFLTKARNDLQPVAQRLCAGVSQALEWLQSQGLAGRMTGSGSAVFAWAAPDHSVPKAPDALLVRLCSSLEAHPLAGWATSDGFGR